MRWLRRFFAWIWRTLFAPKQLTRRTVRYGEGDLDATREVVDVSGGPLVPGHRRRALHDPRLLPKPNRKNPWEKPPPVFDADTARRLFSATLRTRVRKIRTLVADEEQLARYDLPVWRTEADLARALGISVGMLRHLSIHRARERAPHYVTFAVPKRGGGERLICAPKVRLKAVQRTLLDALVDRLPVHSAAHGFRSGRSVATCAAPHVGKKVVVRMDLADFFGTVTYPRVRGYFIALGYGYEVATVLAVLMTASPRQPVEIGDVLYHVPVGPRSCPQGAPTSPGLCNAIVHKLDRRLAGLAAALGCAYTRYADDLTFSSDDPAVVGKLLRAVREIAEDEGFLVRRDKTRVMRAGRHQTVCGVTVNETLGLSRRTRRRLRAMIHEERSRRAEGGGDDARAAIIDGWLAYLSMLSPTQAAPLEARWRAGR